MGRCGPLSWGIPTGLHRKASSASLVEGTMIQCHGFPCRALGFGWQIFLDWVFTHWWSSVPFNFPVFHLLSSGLFSFILYMIKQPPSSHPVFNYSTALSFSILLCSYQYNLVLIWQHCYLSGHCLPIFQRPSHVTTLAFGLPYARRFLCLIHPLSVASFKAGSRWICSTAQFYSFFSWTTSGVICASKRSSGSTLEYYLAIKKNEIMSFVGK